MFQGVTALVRLIENTAFRHLLHLCLGFIHYFLYVEHPP